MINKVFGKLTVESLLNKRGRDGCKIYKCKCSCGNYTEVPSNRLRFGNTKSCGCGSKDNKANLKHGKYKTRTYRIWGAMKQRCLNPNNSSYHRYGGRGITIDPSWVISFESFLKDMGEAPETMEIDRVDNNKGYYKNNCRWTTKQENSRNRSTTKLFTYKGEVMDLKSVSDVTGVNYRTLCKYCETLTLEQALEKIADSKNKQKLLSRPIHLYNSNTGENFKGFRLDFLRDYPDCKDINKVILGERKSCKGWSMA